MDYRVIIEVIDHGLNRTLAEKSGSFRVKAAVRIKVRAKKIRAKA